LSSQSMPKGKSANLKTFAPLAVLIILTSAISLFQPGFVTGVGLEILAYQAIPILLLGLGQFGVIQLGRIDLSSATVAVLASVSVAQLLEPLGVLESFASLGSTNDSSSLFLPQFLSENRFPLFGNCSSAHSQCGDERP